MKYIFSLAFFCTMRLLYFPVFFSPLFSSPCAHPCVPAFGFLPLFSSDTRKCQASMAAALALARAKCLSHCGPGGNPDRLTRHNAAKTHNPFDRYLCRASLFVLSLSGLTVFVFFSLSLQNFHLDGRRLMIQCTGSTTLSK